jgi:transcriptional regulator with XRE-family HTH domain
LKWRPKTIRQIKAHKLRGIREARGLSRRALGELSGVHPVLIAKMELGQQTTTHEEKVVALAGALDVPTAQIAGGPPLSEISRWAEAHGYSRAYAIQLAHEGRIEGATKDSRGQWSVDVMAEKLPPTKVTRDRERDRYRQYRKEYQRRRRAAIRSSADGRSGDNDPEEPG